MAKLLKFLKNEQILFLGIGFLLFFIPIYPKFPLIAIRETYVNIRLEDIFVSLLVGIFLIQVVLKKDFSLLNKFLTRLILFFFWTGALSAVSGILITKNVTAHLVFLHWLRRVEYILLFFIAYSSFKDIKKLKTFGWLLLISTFGVIIYGLGQKFFGWPVVSTMNKEFSKGMILRLTWWARVNSTFAGHYDLAAYMVMILPLATIALMISKKIKVKILILILGLLCFYILLLTASRISYAAYLAAVLLVLLLANKKWWIIPFLTISLLGMVFSQDLGQRYAATFKINLSFLSADIKLPKSKVAMAPTPTPTMVPLVVLTEGPKKPGTPKPTSTLTPTPTPESEATASAEYFEPTELAVGRSTDIRLKVEWPRAIRAFLKNPLLGTGYSSITLATDNDYLRILGETGLLGAIVFLAVILEIVREIFFFLREGKGSKEARLIVIGVCGAGVGYFLNAGFIDVFEASKIAFFFWILMGIALKIIDIESSKFKVQNSK